ncbi:MAG TPA: NACHT domain-containing protein [Candidatus Cybelea sp.]|nr:NACHT domain-containing protein [Candidatus Cybelea sp.]
MSEKTLRRRILLPLLDKYDFSHVEERHGPHEKGVDILCLKNDEMGDTDIVVIQVKKLRFSGAATSKGHLHGLLNQLSQCLKEPVKLPDGTCRLASRTWFVSPFSLNIGVLETSFAAFSDSFAHRIKVIDGPKLVNALQSKAPELLAQLGDKSAACLKRIQTEMTLVQESSALRLPDKISILPIYVQLDFSLLGERVVEFLSTKGPVKSGLASIAAALRSKLARFRYEAQPGARAQALIELQSHANWVLEEITRVSGSLSLRDVRQSLSRDSRQYRLNIDPETLLRSKLNFQIVGPAGAGKTTLLRMLAYTEATRSAGRIPIFVSLAAFARGRPIFDQVQQYCKDYGLAASKQSVLKLLQSGDALLLLDGIDEAESASVKISEELPRLMKQFKAPQWIFTARAWATLTPDPLFCTAALLPFTREQVDEFFQRWFKDNRAHASEIIQHLQKNSHLYGIISTPLVATIFAVVKLLGGSLPSSLNELYEERLRLLLHDWDAVKGVTRDRFSPKDKRFFLRKLAFGLHSQHLRAVPWQGIIKQVVDVLGEIRTTTEAEAFALELVNHNNLLSQDAAGEWGLGHLRFQEHLAAVEARENPNISLADFIDSGWWTEVLTIYADITRDISPMISKVYKARGGEGLSNDPEVLLALLDLLKLAPNTDRKERYRIEKDWEIYTSVEKSFKNVSDTTILRGKGKPRAPSRN